MACECGGVWNFLAVVLIIMFVYCLCKKDGFMAEYGNLRWDLGKQRATTARSIPKGAQDVIQVSPI